MKTIYEDLSLCIKIDEDKLKNEKGISGLEIYKLKKAKYKIISEKTFDKLLNIINKNNE